MMPHDIQLLLVHHEYTSEFQIHLTDEEVGDLELSVVNGFHKIPENIRAIMKHENKEDLVDYLMICPGYSVFKSKLKTDENK